MSPTLFFDSFVFCSDWIARVPTILMVLFFYIRWMIEEHRAPKRGAGFVPGRFSGIGGGSPFKWFVGDGGGCHPDFNFTKKHC